MGWAAARRRSSLTTFAELASRLHRHPCGMEKRTYFLSIALLGGLASHGMMRPAPAATPPPRPEQLAELWVEPQPNRDLFWGVGGERLKPDPSIPYKVHETKSSGFSMGFDVEGPAGREWSVKLPPEATTEVVASRILWGVGYHQPPI